MKQVFAPGCTLLIYKPDLAARMFDWLKRENADLKEHTICCHHDPQLLGETCIINTCAGCDRRYRELYEGVSTLSFWESLAESDDFPFPDYNQREMTIADA